ncbi:hypothetical protein Tco_1126119, partial [Tanacetum coccineum]
EAENSSIESLMSSNMGRGSFLKLSLSKASAMLDEVNLNGTSHGGNSSSDNEVAVGEDEDLVTCNGTSTSDSNPFIQENKETDGDLKMGENPNAT